MTALRTTPVLAYLAVLVGVAGHASSELFAVPSGAAGPEVSDWRYLLGVPAFSWSPWRARRLAIS